MNIYSKLVPDLIDLAISIQQIPAPTFQERPRADFVRQLFLEEGLEDVCIDQIGNVYARYPGAGQKPPLVISAHSDTVFPSSTELKLERDDRKIQAPGIGDNSIGVAGLFGLLWALRGMNIGYGKDLKPLPGDLCLVVNVCEEGLGNLRGMRAVVDRFQDQVLGYIVLEGMALGQVYHRALGVRRYRITVRTSGGHSWVDYGQPSAVNELAKLITTLNALSLPDNPRTTLNVGVIRGGTSINTIAAEASLELDLRSEGEDALEDLVNQVDRLVMAMKRKDIQVISELIGQRPAGQIPATHPLVRQVSNALLAQGVQPVLSIGSTDANVPLSRGFPAVCVGLTTGGGAHTMTEFINISPIAKGLALLVGIVRRVFSNMG